MKHVEISHEHGPEHQAVLDLREDFYPLLAELHVALHDDEVIMPGKQWTVEMNSSCGFKARVIVQVDSFGDCSEGYPVPELPTNGQRDHD